MKAPADKPPVDTDREPNAPHPRETFSFVGHQASEAMLAEALNGARMHHAWLITGPKGLGKASLAYRFARVALGARATGPRPLDVDAEDPVARRIAAAAHPDMFVLRRGLNDKTGKPRREISADEARALGGFFALKPAEGGRRIALVDCVDDLNRHAANALLKTLEEPPPNAVLLLVCHAPGGALATIRSRCRRLSLRPLEPGQVAAALGDAASPALLRLAKGRPGKALALHAQGGGAISAGLDRDMASLAKGGARVVLPQLYEKLAGEPYERLAALIELAGDWAHGQGVESGGEAWAEAWSALEALRVEAEDLDMDPKHALARAIGVLDRAAAARR